MTANLTGLTTAQARSIGNYTNFGDFPRAWYQGADMCPILCSEALPESGGTVGVFNARQLQLVNASLSGNFTLLADIDLAATSSTTASAGIGGASGWVQLGTNGVGAGRQLRDRAVAAPTLAGRLVSQIVSGGTVTRSYWDATTSGRATSAGGFGRTTAHMQDPATYAGRDFDNTWTIAGTAYSTLR